MGETFLDERKFLPPPPPPPIHILMQGMQESKQTMTSIKSAKNPKRKTLQKKQNPTKKPPPDISTSSTNSTLNLPNVQNLKPRNETQMTERCTNTSKDFWKKSKLPRTQETKPVTKLQQQSNLCCCTKQASKQARISPSPPTKNENKNKNKNATKTRNLCCNKAGKQARKCKKKILQNTIPFFNKLRDTK
jgi:hypothetical protein